jgi:hypothetical protein
MSLVHFQISSFSGIEEEIRKAFLNEVKRHPPDKHNEVDKESM